MRRIVLWSLVLLLLGAAPGLTSEQSSAEAPRIVRMFGGSYINVHAVIGDKVVLVDAHDPGKEKQVLKQLARHGIQPSDVSLIVLTHAHTDHAGSAKALSELTGAPIAVGRGDVEMAKAGRNPPKAHMREVSMSALGRSLIPLLKHRYPGFEPGVVVDDTLDLAPYGVAGEVRMVGGHTPGSLAVLLPDGRALVGDQLRAAQGKAGKPVMHFFQEDFPGSIAALEGVMAAGATELHMGHGGPLSAEAVKAWIAENRPE